MDGPELSCTVLYLTFNLITLLKRYNSEEAFKNADGLARGELAGKVETGATLQTPAELRGSGEESPVPLLHPCPVTQDSHIPLHRSHPELSCT